MLQGSSHSGSNPTDSTIVLDSNVTYKLSQFKYACVAIAIVVVVVAVVVVVIIVIVILMNFMILPVMDN